MFHTQSITAEVVICDGMVVGFIYEVGNEWFATCPQLRSTPYGPYDTMDEAFNDAFSAD